MTQSDNPVVGSGSNLCRAGARGAPAGYRWLVPVFIAAIMLFGLMLRFKDFPDWLAGKDRTFFEGRPLLSAMDGYFYLRIARDILEDSRASRDNMRGVPQGVARPAVPPLMSAAAAGICRLTAIELEWVGFLLPAFFGVLLAVPLFAFGRYMSCTVAGIGSAVMGLAAPYYVYRSGMGWFDTDCMNVTWALAVAYCFMRFGNAACADSPESDIEADKDGGKRRTACRYGYIWLLAGLVLTALFFWWWDQSSAAVLVITALPLFSAFGLICFRKSRMLFCVIMLMLFAVLATVVARRDWFSGDLGRWLAVAEGQFLHVIKRSNGDTSRFSLSISEQSRPGFDLLVSATTASISVLLISLAGLAASVFRKSKVMLFLLSFFALSLLAVYSSERFLIFLSPLLALGFGYLAGVIWKQKWRRKSIRFAAPALIIAGLLPSLFSLGKNCTAWPKTEARRIEGISQLAKITPENSVIWSLWDNGYAINYFARRATITDGQIHGYDLNRYSVFPFAVVNPALASSFMRTYAAEGRQGVREFMEDESTFHPGRNVPEGPPVYLFLDSLMLSSAPAWLAFSARYRDLDQIIYQPVLGIVVKDEFVYGDGGLFVDTGAGICTFGENAYGLRHLMVRESAKAWMLEYQHEEGGCFEVMAPRGFGVLMNPELAESIFNRLFVRLDPGLGEWFDPIRDMSPDYQIWKVVDLK